MEYSSTIFWFATSSFVFDLNCAFERASIARANLWLCPPSSDRGYEQGVSYEVWHNMHKYTAYEMFQKEFTALVDERAKETLITRKRIEDNEYVIDDETKALLSKIKIISYQHNEAGEGVEDGHNETAND